MFRVTKDPMFDHYYIHKKFLFWWVKWANPKSNMTFSINSAALLIEKGHYEFSPGNLETTGT